VTLAAQGAAVYTLENAENEIATTEKGESGTGVNADARGRVLQRLHQPAALVM
jgi:hypothetical protein